MSGDSTSYANSGLNRFGGIPAYTPDPYKPPNFSAPQLSPMRVSAGGGGSLGGSLGGLGGMGGEGGAIGPPAASTNPGLSNSVTSGLVGMVLGPAAAMAVNGLLGGGGPGASSGVGSGAAATAGGDAAPAGVGIGEGIGGVSDGGGGGGGGGK